MYPHTDISQTWYGIVNPVAGFGRGLEDLPHITKLIRENEIPHELVFSQHKYHVTELTVQAVNEGYRRIIVIGGDGTLHEVVNGLFIQKSAPIEDITVAVIPVGTGNDWIRMYGIPTRYSEAVRAIKEGHTFSGWSEIPETMPAEDMIISGFFTVNTYKVYYYVGEELVYTAEVAYGEAIPEYVYEPTAEGDVFVGWVGETYETMPAHDVTYKAEMKIADGIEVLGDDGTQWVVYDLMGQKVLVDDVRELSKGLYIINGRKVLIKE